MIRQEEVKKLVSSLTLGLTESHMLFNHLGKDDEFLKGRIKTEGKLRASTFTVDKNTVLRLIKETLLDEEYDAIGFITAWLNDPTDGEDLEFDKVFDAPIGKGYIRSKEHDWNEGAMTLYQCHVAIAKVERKYDTTFVIKSAYPV